MKFKLENFSLIVWRRCAQAFWCCETGDKEPLEEQLLEDHLPHTPPLIRIIRGGEGIMNGLDEEWRGAELLSTKHTLFHFFISCFCEGLMMH